MSEAGTDTAPPKDARRHRAQIDVKLGGFSITGCIAISTGGLVAITGIVGMTLAGTAGIVWTATGPARRHAERGKPRK